MKRETVFIATIMLFVIVLSCDDNSEPESASSISPIVETTLPELAQVGQKITFTVRHEVYNGCGYYANQQTTGTGKELYVTFYARYRGQILCSLDIPVLETDYSYTFNEPGIHTFNFNKGEGEYLTQTITVN